MRKIIHIDADAFYASVEMRENPELKMHPIAVGGLAERRGVIATCNYIARQFGVRSAMSSIRAVQLCPDLIILSPRFDLYRSVSRQMHAIFREYTHLIEPLSLDEAFLDVSECENHQGSATFIAEDIRKRIEEELNITVSAGVAPNKFLAKIASDWKKPNGLFVIPPKNVDSFVRKLPVNKISGVGKVTASKLESLGIQTCEDLQSKDKQMLIEMFGSYGEKLHNLARGVDLRPVETSRSRKSQSVEYTFDSDLPSLESIVKNAEPVFEELLRRYAKISDQYLVTKRFVKIKFADFSQTTLEEGIGSFSYDWQNLPDYQRLLASAWERQKKPVRLLGMGVRLREAKVDLSSPQLALFS